MSELREFRERLVRQHMESENIDDFDATLDTFAHPRYEIIRPARSTTAKPRCAGTSTRPERPSQTSAMS